ncbi:MAG: hypothetical protein HUJ68_10065 [Clostridia bacterium]|nr:hypothetical protein [Clostridia bacterium]
MTNRGIVVIKESKKPIPGRVESIITVTSNFGISEEKLNSLIESGEALEFEGNNYYFDEMIDE